MLTYYKTYNDKVIEVEKLEEGCWVNVINPSKSDFLFLIETMGIEEDFIRASIDPEERAHIDIEENKTLVILDMPTKCEDDKDNIKNTVLYTTLPIGIVLTPDNVVTITTQESDILTEIISNKVKNINTCLRTRFFLTLLLRISVKYLQYLRQIERISEKVEKELHQSMKNKELIQLLGLEKSLVYFSTSLKSNEVVLQKILKGRVIKLYDEDQDILEDVIIEVNQAIEMSHIYASILSGTMDAFASVISNNLNIVMKVLTSITIVMSIPNMVFS
ncbi:MAG: magnesium transporter CorA family protein, partial [Oscillospiraceae bacterium]